MGMGANPLAATALPKSLWLFRMIYYTTDLDDKYAYILFLPFGTFIIVYLLLQGHKRQHTWKIQVLSF